MLRSSTVLLLFFFSLIHSQVVSADEALPKVMFEDNVKSILESRYKNSENWNHCSRSGDGPYICFKGGKGKETVQYKPELVNGKPKSACHDKIQAGIKEQEARSAKRRKVFEANDAKYKKIRESYKRPEFAAQQERHKRSREQWSNRRRSSQSSRSDRSREIKKRHKEMKKKMAAHRKRMKSRSSSRRSNSRLGRRL